MKTVGIEYDSDRDLWISEFGPVGIWRTESHCAGNRARRCIHAVEIPNVMLFCRHAVEELTRFPALFNGCSWHAAIASRTGDFVTMAVDHMKRIEESAPHRELVRLNDSVRFVYRLFPVHFRGDAEDVKSHVCLGVWPD